MPLLDTLTDRIRERWHEYHSEAVTELPAPASLRPREWVISGAFAQIGMSTRRRWVLDSGTIAIDHRSIFESPSGAARLYLSEIYRDARQRKIYHHQAQALARTRMPMPLLADPCELSEPAVYMDIRRAYFQIMLIAGWDVDYCPGKWLLGGRPPSDFPWIENSVARNSMVSCAASSTITQISPEGEILERPTYNRFLNMPLVALVSHVLNGVAYDLAGAGVGLRYANTDGFIVSAEHAARAQAIISAWGLSSRPKAYGRGWVAGVGVYRVGSVESKRPRVKNPYSNLRPPQAADWLKGQFSRLAADYPPAPELIGAA